MQAPTHLWHNGRIKAWHEATVHVGAHALHYGSSVFEGVRVYSTPDGPRYFRLEEHTERLFNSARVYDLTIPYDADAINRACREVIAANGLESAYVRPIVYRSGFTFSLAPPLDTAVDVAIIALPWGAYHGADAIENGVDVCVSSWNRAAPNTFPSGAKAGGNYLNSQLIAREAINGGYAEGIALGTDGLLSEGAGENLFVVRNGKLYTPPSAASILCGITRDSVLTLARERGIDVIEQALPREMLYFADEVFMTGTAAEVTAVRSVDRKPVGSGKPGPITRQIQQDFFGLFDGRTEDKWGWLTPIENDVAAGRVAA
ncbi:branched-chain amino acid aminotransferase [Luteibacter rhizovicinus]|uniref:Branched-chain-amino-acid aminotransferase n=1 Tax=Luteibacter rhizovicinus TaxID=242606 RepID=A0A4R3YLQ5_9GAMM|nr:branched-chain amino acid transaminase [Luteibacter rhizovicinus]TCV92398.1 branched-chain amino acid aminotransferase [Luteibacter rhizovicinus]